MFAKILKYSLISTKLGTMWSIADNNFIYLLKFAEEFSIEKEIERLSIKLNANLIPATNNIIKNLQIELTSYFKGKLEIFKTPFSLPGTDFQKKVWQALQKIPYGQTCSYMEIAKAIDFPRAGRAVGLANSKNHLEIIVPCHRVINANGKLGGYSAGLTRKQWLLNHEKKQTTD